MFATLLGGLPRPPLDAGAGVEDLVEEAIRAQEAAGLEPLTDGGLRPGPPSVDGWLVTAARTDRAVKQAIVGPYTDGRTRGDAQARSEATLARAAALNELLRDLEAAGCPMVEVHEPAAVSIGTDHGERALFRESQLRLLDGLTVIHPSLAITGGAADAAGLATILAAPYASLAVDLIAGPDNWRLVAETPGECGIVCGALSSVVTPFDGPETLLWAAGYAASMRGRGPDRVGLATASSLAALPWDVAVEKLERLGVAARLAVAPAGERTAAMDPRAVSSRSAALGRAETRATERPGDPPYRPPEAT
jgi:cobalamin-independent methionine synthase catalytic subunit